MHGYARGTAGVLVADFIPQAVSKTKSEYFIVCIFTNVSSIESLCVWYEKIVVHSLHSVMIFVCT